MKVSMRLSTSLNAITWLTGGREPKTVHSAHHRGLNRISEAAGFEITTWAYFESEKRGLP